MSKTKIADRKLVLKYMQAFGSITAREASRILDVDRLSGRIYDLRREGYIIDSIEEKNTNKSGTHARYVLREADE